MHFFKFTRGPIAHLDIHQWSTLYKITFSPPFKKCILRSEEKHFFGSVLLVYSINRSFMIIKRFRNWKKCIFFNVTYSCYLCGQRKHILFYHMLRICTKGEIKVSGTRSFPNLKLACQYDVHTYIYLCANYFAKCATNSFR